MLEKTNIYRCYLLTCAACGFYIFGFFPAPYYIFLACGMCMLCMSRIRKIDVNIFIIMLLIILYMFILLWYSKINVWSYYFLGLWTFLFILLFRDNLTTPQKNSIVKMTISLSTLIIFLDTAYRFIFPRVDYLNAIAEQGNVDYIFYGYKHSFLFQDSNFVALFAISIYFLFRENKHLFKYRRIITCCLIGLIILTFSRAAIVALILVELLRLYSKSKINITIKCIVAMAMTIPVSYLFFGIIKNFNDDSFESKFMLLHKFIQTIEQRDILELMFGWGLDNTRDHWGIAAHSLFNTLLIETGIIGSILILLTMLYCWTINKRTGYHFFAIIIASLSFGLIFTPIFIPLALNIIMRDISDE